MQIVETDWMIRLKAIQRIQILLMQIGKQPEILGYMLGNVLSKLVEPVTQ